MDFLEELSWRGMIHQKIDGVENYLSTPGQFGYIGFDPTAPSMTIGNYVQVMLLSFFQRAGHRPIALLGGATGRIGDPSGKNAERQLLNYDLLDQNLNAQAKQLERFLDFTGSNGAVLENNLDFYQNMNVLDYLRNVGKNLTVNYMMSKDSVKNRLETGMSYTEFSYQLLQGYDFLELYKKHGCALQMGGSDQWGNITSGAEFIRRSATGAKSYAVTTPLLTKADGTKFGKSESGNLWLSPELTSPYQFYQFWLNCNDADLPSFIRYFSFKNREEVEALEAEHENNPNALKRILAEELTQRVHSPQDAERVQKVSELMFGRSINAESIAQFDAETLFEVSRELPSFDLSKDNLAGQVPWIELLTEHTQIFSSKGDFRRAVKGNALSINKVKVTNPDDQSSSSHILDGGFVLVENGKKNKYMLTIKS